MQDEQDNENMDAIDARRDAMRVHKLGSDKEPATKQDVEQTKDAIRRDAVRCPTDTELLDWLQGQTRGYGFGWIVRDSCCGRGMRLHETSRLEASLNVREAIIDAMSKGK